MTLSPGSAWENTVFRDEDFSDGLFQNITFTRCSFKNIPMDCLVTEHCTFDQCDFTFTRLGGSTHRFSGFLNCRFSGASLFGARFFQCKGTGTLFADARLTGAVFTGGSYSYATFGGCDLSRQDLSGISFAGADLQGCRFQKSVLTGCSFSRALLSGADFTGADLRGAVLSGVDFRSITMKNTLIDLNQAVLITESLGAHCADL